MSTFRAMRPAGLYENVLKQREIDGVKFYRANHKEFVEVDCPACGSREKIESFKKWGYNHFTCTNCTTLYCSPRPSDELLVDFYNNYNAPKMWTDLLVAADVSRKRIQYSPRVKKILSIMGKKEKGGGGCC